MLLIARRSASTALPSRLALTGTACVSVSISMGMVLERERTSRSVFFVLMRSEHDDLLNFPFKQSVPFTLINQSNHAENVTEAFAPDIKSQSFQKPEGEMNVASGFPKFAGQSVLHDKRFMKGNVIYIKAQVDLNGLALE